MTTLASNTKLRVLLVEDNVGDVFLFREALASAGLVCDLTVISDGAEALDFVNNAARRDGIPDLAVLDLNLPKVEGTEVLEAIRSSRELAHIPVAVMTSSPSP